jgi:beta-lactamase class A
LPAATIGIPPASTPFANSARTPLSETELAQRINALLGDRAGRYSVVVEMPDGEARFRSRADTPTEAASLYKLAIMVELYHQRQEGWLDFSDTITLEPRHFLEDTGEIFAIGETYPIDLLLDRMITSSSNVAAAALLARVGNLNINTTMAQLGLESTEIRWMPGAGLSAYPWPSLPAVGSDDELVYNVTSAADMGLLFRLLLDGEVVSHEASAEMLDLLEYQAINDRLPVRLPATAVVAHKTGNLPGLYHDVGVIYTPSGPAVVAVLTAEADEFEAVGFMAQLGELVYYSAP